MDPGSGIDPLLERYLGLLDEYTQMRAELSRLQTGMYQNIARANFSAERGMRYGQDYFDDRMQASRILQITTDHRDLPRFKVAVSQHSEGPDTETDEGSGKNDDKEHTEGCRDNKNLKDAKTDGKKKPVNPLHWYGLLTPLPLRQAQTLAVQSIEEVIPKLVSVNAEMLAVEIEVRRARKKRAKAGLAGAKISREHHPPVLSTEKAQSRASEFL
jgi:coiled-coil domain-containing protein 115